MDETMLQSVMGIILSAGDAKNEAMEALKLAKSSDFEGAEQKLEKANECLMTAHKSQTSLLTQEAAGESFAVTLLVVHCQDHLMTSITFLDLAREMVDLRRDMTKDE